MVKTEALDAARYLTSPEAQAELLNDSLASGDAAYVARAFGVIARARGMTEIAREAGITREALYKALSEEGDPRLTNVAWRCSRFRGDALGASQVACLTPPCPQVGSGGAGRTSPRVPRTVAAVDGRR